MEMIGVDEYDRALYLACEALKKGKLIIYPTDTLYGLGADARSEEAVARAREAKGRDDLKPISIVCSGLLMIEEYCEVSEKNKDIMANMLPGPYTVVLPIKGGLAKNLSGEKTVGVRVPQYYFLLDLIKAFGFPITATSANVSGEKEPCLLSEVSKKIIERAEIAIDGGKCFHSAPSTVLDMTEKEPKVLRKGAGKFPIEREFDSSIV
ncbi:MAG: L-threonylcarbamoyladenylate synthase [Candidatus Micrarchaeota archaeon]